MLTIYFDGACEPYNPGGVATGGYLIYEELHQTPQRLVQSDYFFIKKGEGATNNVAEWIALGFALRWLLDNPGQGAKGNTLQIYGDSRLVINQLTGEWQTKAEHLKKFQVRCLEILKQMELHFWAATWIPREENQEADALSQKAYETYTGRKFPVRK